jgi:hypothetical protein
MGREKENYIEQLLKERDLERQVMIVIHPGNHCSGSGSGSLHYQAKIIRKTFISTV